MSVGPDASSLSPSLSLSLSLSPFTLSSPYWFLPFPSSLSLCFHANLLFIKSKELVPPRAYSNLLSPTFSFTTKFLRSYPQLDSFHDFLPFFSLKNVSSFLERTRPSIIYSPRERETSRFRNFRNTTKLTRQM